MKLTTKRLKQIIREEIQGLEEKIRLRRGPPPQPSPVAFHRRDDGTMVPGRKADKVSNPDFKKIKFNKKKPESEFEKDEREYAMYVQQGLEEEVDEAINLRTKKKEPKPDIKFRKDSKTGKMVPAGKKIRRNPFGTTDAEEREAKRLAFSGKKTVSPPEEKKRAALKGPTASSMTAPEEEETEFERDQRQRREQDSYIGENISSLEERIFKMLVAKINGASK